jgi:hypothetical protein
MALVAREWLSVISRRFLEPAGVIFGAAEFRFHSIGPRPKAQISR